MFPNFNSLLALPTLVFATFASSGGSARVTKILFNTLPYQVNNNPLPATKILPSPVPTLTLTKASDLFIFSGWESDKAHLIK